jgi:two-component system sensor histidine kinase PilS (NtrC family)
MVTIPRTYLDAKSGWLLPLRLITFCLISGVVVVWLKFPSYLQVPFFSYCFITLAALTVLLALKRFKLASVSRFLIGLQIVVEILNEAGIVYTTGSLYSPFSAMFLLTIVSAAMVYRLVGTLMVASLVSVSYATVTWINAYLLAPGHKTIPLLKGDFYTADDILFYSTFLHILIFYLVAFISGYLAQKVQSKDKELHSTSNELRKARLETGDILWHLNCGLITIDTGGDIVFFNRTAEDILGLKETDISGKNCRQALDGNLADLADNLMSVLESKEWLSRSEFNITNKDDKAIPLGISTSVLRDENFGVRGVIAIFQDLTQAKMMEEKVRRADRMAAIGELSACIAHEIRNPLASISGSVEILKKDLTVDGDNEKLMSLIIKESSRLNNILSDFLLYARVGRSRFQKIELNSILSDVIELIRRHPVYHEGINIELLAKDHITYISGDEDQLRQLLLNLGVNACEAIGDRDGNLQLEIHPDLEAGDKNAIWLVIRDDGPGIASEQLDKIFIPFYSTKRGGTGLGLSIVSRLMEALNGKVEVLSQPGQGTEFRLRFCGLACKKPAVQDPPLSTISHPL